MPATTKATAARARLNPGRQWIGIDHIILDERFQARVKTDFDWVHELSNFRKDGSEFPPCRVYQLEDGRLIAASGHHRIPAMRLAGEDQVLCDLADGTEADAIAFAVGSNNSNGVKPMGSKDITRAVVMLFAIDEWWHRSDARIAGHVGCSTAKVASVRQQLIAKGDRLPPERVEAADGKMIDPRRHPGKIMSHVDKRGNRTHYRAYVGGRAISSTNRERVEKRVAEERRKLRGHRIDIGASRNFLSRLGFRGIFVGMTPSYPGMTAYHRPGIICTECIFDDDRALPTAIGRAIAGRRFKETSARIIILCYTEDGPARLIELYRREGFEFLTPDELAASLAAGPE